MSIANDRTITALEEVIAYKEGSVKGARVTRIQTADIDVKSLRDRLGFTQEQFSKRYGFKLSTLRNWEQGRRTPEGPALILLKVIENNPEVVEKAAHA